MRKIDSIDKSIPEDSRNVQVTLTGDQTLTINDTKRVKKPSFLMVASGMGKGDNVKNYTNELLNMSTAEGFAFQLIMDNRDVPDELKPYVRSNYSYVHATEMSKKDKNKMYEGYKGLLKKDLVIRVKPHYYLINPELVICNDDMYNIQLARYKKLKNAI